MGREFLRLATAAASNPLLGLAALAGSVLGFFVLIILLCHSHAPQCSCNRSEGNLAEKGHLETEGESSPDPAESPEPEPADSNER